ncbi:MAG: hypothetical protein EA350_10520 [Gemmatimonadales bacterium]|nr:MAG: hypothetical protein EA350_10520 [Gemmatimonadales bacterium]
MNFDRESTMARGPGWEERRNARADAADRWERRAGEWAALDLARHVFGADVEARLAGWPARAPFRGLLALRVPFHSLADHRRREQVFLLLAGRDPVVSRIPFLYVFEPAPVRIPS